MRVLNIEDEPIKHRKIKDVLESCRVMDVDRAGNLEDGIARYKEALASDKPYDLIISDMYYPREKGGGEEKSGDILVSMAHDEQWNVPIIICSSQNYSYPEIFGTLYYSENVDWEGELRKLIGKLKKS